MCSLTYNADTQWCNWYRCDFVSTCMRRWLNEEASTSTRENAVFSLQMAQERGWSSVLVVTSPFHQRRSQWTFLKAAKDLGLQATSGGWPVGSREQGDAVTAPETRVYMAQAPFLGHMGYSGGPLHDAAVDVWDWIREVLAMAYYWAKGYI